MRLVLLSVLISFSVLFAEPAFAQERVELSVFGWGANSTSYIVPQCGETRERECNVCDFAKLVSNLFRFLIYFATVITALLFMWAGFMLMTAGENSNQRSEAREIVSNVVIGFVFLLGAWIIVDTIMKTFLKNNGQVEVQGSLPQTWGPWNHIICPPGFKPSVGTTTPLGQSVEPPLLGSASNSAGITHEVAMQQLCQANIKVWSSTTGIQDACGAVDGRTTCVGVKDNTIKQVVNVGNACGANNTIVTGCSESGHESGTYSHGTGYKIDLENTAQMDACLKSRLTPAGVRGGEHGGPRYKDKCGNEYVYETYGGGHWDIMVERPCPI